MGNGAMAKGPSHRAHPRLYHKGHAPSSIAAAQKGLARLTSLPTSVRRTLGMPTMIISHGPQNVSAWLTESNLMPPKDPHDDDDENEPDEEDDDAV